MSHGTVGYAKGVNFEHLYSLNVFAFRFKKPLSERFYNGQGMGFVQTKGAMSKKGIEFK